MHKLIQFLATGCILSFSVTCLADNMDTSTLQTLHSKVRSSFYARCRTDLTGATDSLCNCLADKVQASLDDNALNKCTPDASGTDCIANVVSNAARQGMSQPNMDLCSKVAPSAAATANAGTVAQPTASPAPQNSNSSDN